MWGSFVLAAMFALILLYLPGYLLGRVYFSSSANSLAFAPVLTIALLVLLGVIAFPLSLSWFVLPSLALLVSIIIFLIFRKPLARETRRSWLGFGAYVLMGTLVTVVVYLANIDGATSFSVQTDTTFHLQCAQAMLQSGHYSVLSASVYPDVIANGKGGFYPAAWHIVTALISEATSVPVTVAYNAINFVICAVSFPLSSWLFMSRLFANDEASMLAGAIVCNLFACFPWNFLVYGQYDANLLSFALVPSFLYLVLCVLDSQSERLPVLGSVAMLVVAGFCLAVCQTNALFTAGVLCIPLLFQFAWRKAICNGVVCGVLVSLAVCFAIAAAWYFAYSLPFMQSVVQCQRDVCATHFQGLINILLLSFGSGAFAPQPVLAALVFVGALLIIFRKRSYLWILFSYLIICFLYYVCASVDGPIRQLLCGFWYVGANRIGGMAILAAMPIAAVSLGWVVLLLTKRSSISALKAGCFLCASLLVLGILSDAILGQFGLKSGMRSVSDKIDADYKYSNPVAFDQAERDFIERVKPYVGDDLVVNIPSDGSVWLYGMEGINTQCRTFYGSPSDEYCLFKTSLNQVATNQDVERAVKESGAKWLLYLDESVHAGSFDVDEWEGILSVTDDTLGFDAVLADGNMRLYRIVASPDLA